MAFQVKSTQNLQSSYNFAKKFNKKTIKIKNTNNKFPSKQTMNLSKLRNILKQNN